MRKHFTLLLSLVCLCMCSISPEISAQKKPKAIAKHLIFIGSDGFGAYAYEKAEMPNLKKLASEGSWSLKARTVLPSSSAVNWASMLMSSGPTFHGYTEWGSKTPEIPSAVVSQYGKFPSIYTQIKEQKPDANTALVFSWPGIQYLVETEIVNTVFNAEDNDELAAEKAVEVIKNDKPTFLFVHFDQPDNAGHAKGHGTPEYYAELANVDRYIGMIVQAVKDAGIEKETVIIVASDHGGIDKGHGGKNLNEVEIPIVLKGPGIKVDHQIAGTIIDYDYGATFARILGITPHQAWRGVPINDAFK